MDAALVAKLGARARPLGLPVVLATVALAATGVAVLVPARVGEILLVPASAVAALIPLAAARQRGRIEPFDLGVATAVAYFVLFPVRAFVVRLNLDYAANPLVLTSSAHVARKALAVVTLGFVAGGLAYALPAGERLGRRIRIPRVAAAERPGIATALTIFVVGAAAEGLLLAAVRDPSLPLVGGRGSGFVSGGSALMLVGLCLLTRRAARERDRLSVAVVLGSVVLGMTIGLVGQFKEVAVLAVLTPLVSWSFTVASGVRLRWVVAAVLTVVFLVFPLVSVWRYSSGAEGSANPLRVIPRAPHQYFAHDLLTGRPRSFSVTDLVTDPLSVTSHRLYGFDSMMLVVRQTPSQVPYQDGRTLENLAEGLVPRVLWGGKPRIGIGYWFAVHYWGTPKGVLQVPQTVTHPGELWIDFGLAGVIVGLAVLGFWYRFAYAAFRPRESGAATVLYTTVFVTALSVDRDLPLVYVTLVQRVAVASLVLVLLAAVDRVRARGRR